MLNAFGVEFLVAYGIAAQYNPVLGNSGNSWGT
jgi:hypothetical protein